MKQQSFSEAEYLNKGRQTRKERFLKEGANKHHSRSTFDCN